ncbi:lysozyme [Nesidiocoris tenuis]|uniref:lysozyme n=1 Tax=Nesidiocoris tenuis TaxID=355587 RepID=A0ABN7B662_9HEMI|nr:lysozyme [Nesidiocoris tenuis]
MVNSRFSTAEIRLLFLATVLVPGDSKVFGICELSQVLHYQLDVPLADLPMWLCIAYYESNYNTSAVGPLAEDFGLFQISKLFWCDPRGNVENAGKVKSAPPNVCGLKCDRLLDDDISDDVACARTVFQEHQNFEGDGFKAWAVYEPKCKNVGPLVPDWCFPPNYVPINISSKAYDNSI